MVERPLEAMTDGDIQRLVSNGVSEGRSQEYKELLPGGNDAERREFLADVSSLANAAGGDLVFGIREKRDENGKATGVPEAAEGVTVLNRDVEIQRLENMLRDGIAPRIAGLRYRWVDGFPSGAVLVVRVPRSWSGPHMVTYQQLSRFYSRAASGKYLLDVFQLRDAFLNSAGVADRARAFTSERVGRILADEAPVRLTSETLIIVHAVPHASVAGGFNVDIQEARLHSESMAPFYSDSYSQRFNIDGYMTHVPADAGTNLGYAQLFRNGILETVDSGMIPDDSGPGRRHELPTVTFAESLFAFISKTRTLFRYLDISPPVSIFLSLHGLKECRLSAGQFMPRGARPIDRSSLVFPDLLLEDFDGEPSTIARLLLDVLWQAAGLERCLQYNETGEWRRV
jgi:hypothetical protein